MTLLVAGILVGIGVPNVMEFQRNGVMTAAANQLVTGTLMARAEAVKRQVPVTLCLSDNPTAAAPTCLPNAIANSATRGFIVWADENGNVDANGAPILTDATDGNAVRDAGEPILFQSPAPGGTIRTSANCGHISYGPSGFPRQVGALCAPAVRTVLLCDDRGRRVAAGTLSSARILRIDPPGRGVVLQQVGDVNPLIAGTGGACP
jgi:type IV fimbrial biogenesis protein FimT